MLPSLTTQLDDVPYQYHQQHDEGQKVDRREHIEAEGFADRCRTQPLKRIECRLDEEEHKGQGRQQSENYNPQSAPAQFDLLGGSGLSS